MKRTLSVLSGKCSLTEKSEQNIKDDSLVVFRKMNQFSEAQLAYICHYVIKNYIITIPKHDNEYAALIRAGDIILQPDGSLKLEFERPSYLCERKKKTICQMFQKGFIFWLSPEEIAHYLGINPSKTNVKEVQSICPIKASIWGLGILLYELAEGTPPYADQLPRKIVSMLTNSTPVIRDSSKWGADFHSFLSLCLNRDPSKRPNPLDLLKHPFLLTVSETVNPLLSLLTKESSDSELEEGDISSQFSVDESEESNDTTSETDSVSAYDWVNEEEKNDPFLDGEISLAQLAEKMRDPIRGVEIKTRYYKLKAYYRCFIGIEAVDWLVKELKLPNRDEAVAIGETMMFRGLIHHVLHTEPFDDKLLFYQFKEDEKKAPRGIKKLQNMSAFLSGTPTLLIDENAINALIERMIDKNKGIEIKDRKYHLRKYEECFLGNEAVDWMMKNLNLKTRDDAVNLGQLMVSRGVLHHVTDGHPFRDKPYFYRFYKIDKKASSLNLRSPSSLNLSRKSSEEQIKSLVNFLENKPTDAGVNEDQMKINFITKTLKEMIQTRGSITEEESAWLISLLTGEGESEAVSLAAAEALAKYSWPKAYSSKIRKQIFEMNGAFHILLWYVGNGKITVHQEIKKADIKFGSEIASGAAGVVYKGIWDNKEVAVKTFSPENISFDIEEMRRELGIMSMLQNPNLIKCYGGSIEDYIIVMELCTGTLRGILEDKTRKWDVDAVLDIAIQIVRPTLYLHSVDIIHRDLKSSNYLVGKDGQIRLTDFGISQAIKSEGIADAVGTPQWTAPEVYERNIKYSLPADVYSFAIVMWEVLTRKEPWSEVDRLLIPDLVMKGERPDLPETYPIELTQLIKNCWKQDPNARPSFRQILSYLEWLKEDRKINDWKPTQCVFSNRKRTTQLERVLTNPDLFKNQMSNETLDKVYESLKDPENGVPRGDKTFLKIKFKNVFKGADMVVWLQEVGNMTKPQAMKIGKDRKSVV